MDKAWPRRVLIVVPGLSTGGSEKCVLNLVRHLPRESYAFDVVGFRGGPMYALLAEQGCRVHLIRKRPGIDLSLTAKLLRIIRRSRIELVNTHHFMPLFYTFPAAKGLRVPVVHVEHSKWEIEQLGPFWRRVFRLMVLRLDGMVSISRELQRFVTERYGPREGFRPILNGISLDEFDVKMDRQAKRLAFGVQDGEFLVGCVANLRAEKNHEMLLRGFAAAHRKQGRLRLMVVGDGPRMPVLEALSRDLGVRDRVIFSGERSDANELYRIFDAYCLTSLYEGLPLTILEAMASRVPVIGTDVLGIREVIDDGQTGYLVALNAWQELGGRIDAVSKLSARDRRRMVERAHRKVTEEYSIERSAGEYDRLFQMVLSHA